MKQMYFFWEIVTSSELKFGSNGNVDKNEEVCRNGTANDEDFGA
jgi:hypothetical protein